jgi:hypothetical protein
MAENAAQLFHLPIQDHGGPVGALRDWLT